MKQIILLIPLFTVGVLIMPEPSGLIDACIMGVGFIYLFFIETFNDFLSRYIK